METTHENSRFRSQLLEKTSVLKPSKVRDLKSGVRFSHLTFASHLLRNDKVQKANNGTITARISVTALLVSLLASCQPSYANNVKVQQRVNEKNTKFSLRLNSKSEDSSLITSQNGNYGFLTQLNKINQLSFFDGFNCLDLVAVSGNNARQELRKLLTTVQHHTIVDVFLCLSFASCLFAGELRLALALVRLWWGGHGNKPFIGRIPCAVLLRFSNLPTALTLGQSSKNLPFEKV